MLKLIFRILLLGLGLFTIYSFGFPVAKTLWYRTSGKVVEGRVSGFLAGRNSPSVQQEPTGVRKGKRRARRPVFRYYAGGTTADSLTGRSNISTLFTFSQFEINEPVTIVFDPNNPQDSYLYNWQLLLMDLLLVLFGLYMVAIGIGAKVG